MADKVPRIFRQDTPPIIASYSYGDVAEGRGYIGYFAGDLSGGTILSSVAFYPLVGVTYDSQVVLSGAFDLTYNLPQLIDGKTLLSVPVAVNNTAGSAYTGVQEYHLTLSHVSASSVVTDLVSGGIKWFPNAPANDYDETILSFLFDMPKTHFKVGESLRYKFYASASSAATATNAIFHDPSNRLDWTALSGGTNHIILSDTSQTIIKLPYIIQS